MCRRRSVDSRRVAARAIRSSVIIWSCSAEDGVELAKKLIEVALPLDAINARSAPEKLGIRRHCISGGRDVRSPRRRQNTRHRRALGAVTGMAEDLPLLKMLLLPDCSKCFEGSVLGAREKDELQVWEELSNEAIEEELERRSYGEEPRVEHRA